MLRRVARAGGTLARQPLGRNTAHTAATRDNETPPPPPSRIQDLWHVQYGSVQFSL